MSKRVNNRKGSYLRKNKRYEKHAFSRSKASSNGNRRFSKLQRFLMGQGQ